MPQKLPPEQRRTEKFQFTVTPDVKKRIDAVSRRFGLADRMREHCERILPELEAQLLQELEAQKK